MPEKYRFTRMDWLLMIITSFAFLNVRYLVQYNHFAWEKGFLWLIGLTFLHFIMIFIGVFGVFIILYVFKLKEPDKESNIDVELIRTVFAAVLVISLWVLWVYIMRNEPPTDSGYEDYIASFTPLLITYVRRG